MFSHTRLFPGVRETLAMLQAQGRKLAVCSNKSVQFTRRLVDGFDLARFFPVVLGPEDVSAPKPDPAMLLEALRRLEVSKPNAIYVGDMTIDILTSRNAGLTVWLMPNGADARRDATTATPDRLLRDFSEILELVN
jgi:HAD superfamily hydrolase (TIGR01662 family)